MASAKAVPKQYIKAIDQIRFRGLTQADRSGRYHEVKVLHSYSSESKLIRSTDSITAIKANVDGEVSRGWSYVHNGKLKYISEHDVQMVLRSVDHSYLGETSGISLEKTFLNATPKQRAIMAEAVLDVDWAQFWEDYYPEKDGLGDIETLMRPTNIFNDLVKQFRLAISS